MLRLRYYAAMRRIGVAAIGLTVFFLQGISAYAQDTVEALEKDLQDIKQSHQEATSQAVANFFTQVTTASQNPDAALALYQQSGGAMPPPTPVNSQHAHETPTEKEARDAQDAAMQVNLAYVAQLHCGLLHYAALFVTSPGQKGLHDEWIAWLKNTPQIFLQIKEDDLLQTRELKRKAMRDSVISAALGFNSWGDKEQGNWSVKGIPDLYRSEVLEPLRATPNADTLAAWDVYISLKNATEPDQGKWNNVEYPSLMFDRGCDDYAITASMDKLQVLHDLIKANPNHPKFDDMIARLHTLVQDYRTRHPGAVTPQAADATVSGTTTTTDPNVKVTTTTDGDMTIITTKTNVPTSTPPAPPVAPPPPATN